MAQQEEEIVAKCLHHLAQICHSTAAKSCKHVQSAENEKTG
jgi:hypothetical protein